MGTWVGNNSGSNGGWYGTYTNHPLNFFTNNGGPQITLLQNGNVGIGTTQSTLGELAYNTSGSAMRMHTIGQQPLYLLSMMQR